jgi:hypothetical protein
MLRIEMLAAGHGDALCIDYGDPIEPHRLLIDGGARSAATRTLVWDRLTAGSRGLELLVVTHIDADHITGILNVLKDPSARFTPRDVWFNGWDHLPTDVLGAMQGEALSAAIRARRLPWNEDFGTRAVQVPDDGPLPVIRLPGGMELTVLSPTERQLAALRPVWKKEVEAAGLVPGVAAEEPAVQPDILGERPMAPEDLARQPFREDPSEANGASIAMLAEFEGKSLLLAGDAHAGVLGAGLERLALQRGVDRIRVDAFKLPHHGSKHNLSSEVLQLIDCCRFLCSTNGAIFGHPDPEALSRIVVDRRPASLEFNYRSETTQRWDSRRLRSRFEYQTVFPRTGEAGLVVDL